MEFTPDLLLHGLVWYVAFVFSLTLHEAAHAWAALKLGDPTASEGGQVTLNPVPHIARSPFGTVLVPLLSFGFMGWMMGWASAPYDPAWAARHPKRAGWMALAGPVSNLFLMLWSGIAIRVGLAAGYFTLPTRDVLSFDRLVVGGDPTADGVSVLLSILFSLNFLLFLFNLLPLPPLDGSAVIQLVLPKRISLRYQQLLAEPMFALLGLILAWRFFGVLFVPIYGVAVGLLYLGLGVS
ncbi:MAG: site-2 protease family protein [Acidobacteriota bacterium]|nr:site-2 protease family protein [Acidobacteriota bacterium]